MTGGVRRSGVFYDEVGGAEFFTELVARFYQGVAADPVLRAMYPEEDLGPAETRLRMFLEQYWGGPSTYNEVRGHPRLRMRHTPYVIRAAERDRWLGHMRNAIDGMTLQPHHRELLWGYLVMAANSLVNAPDDDESGPVRG